MVLNRDLGFFEGGDGKSVGEIAYRITVEACDVAETVYALLNTFNYCCCIYWKTIVPSSLQLLAMANQMVVISPILSLVCALVIPLMALVGTYFGEKLRDISNQANLSIATLSAYLNEVLPSVLFVKAYNAEYIECKRFERLAHDDLHERLNKKKMKALVPQMVQLTLFGMLLLIFMGSSVAACNCSSVVSFLTSLVLLIEPLQDVRKSIHELKQGEPEK